MSCAIVFSGHPACTSDRIVGSTVSTDTLRPRENKIVQTLRMWLWRSRERHALGRLDNRLLADIGISRDQAMREAVKLFWRC
jgi:uncharacterized protein YjiS (DUF1127 family)